MTCSVPIKFYRIDPSRNNGVGGLTRSVRLSYGDGVGMLSVPCGHCIDCRLDRARDWSLRVMHELQTAPGGAVFATLTYSPANLPEDNGLHYRDFQLFMHRLRKALPGAGRFFMCGEYGEDYGRPHYHAILYNCLLPDCKLWKVNGKVTLYTSKLLSDLWGKGFCSVGAVSLHSAGYVARYALKKITGDASVDVYGEREPPFSHSSLKPGIGFDWFMKYHADVFPCDYVVFEGKKFRVPRYYQELYDRLDHVKAEAVKREHRALAIEKGRALKAEVEVNPRRMQQIWSEHVLNSKNAGRNKGL